MSGMRLTWRCESAKTEKELCAIFSALIFCRAVLSPFLILMAFNGRRYVPVPRVHCTVYTMPAAMFYVRAHS